MATPVVELTIETMEGLPDVKIGKMGLKLSEEEEEWLCALSVGGRESLLEEIAADAHQQIKRTIEWEQTRDEPDPDEGWEEYRRRRAQP